jgi:VanZ family protein
MNDIGEARIKIRTRLAQIALLLLLVGATVGMMAPRDLPIAPTITGADKLDHFMAFVVLAFVAAQALPKRRLWLIGLALAAYGGAIEVVQRFVGRSMDPLDFAADVAGILVGLTLAVMAGRPASLRTIRPRR